MPFRTWPAWIRKGEGKFCGKPCAAAASKARFLERFWQQVEKSPAPDGCWLWTGYCFPSGYGGTYFEGRNQRTHRVAYQIANGPIPAGLIVCHHCDTPACCRPDHLFLGTNDDNLKDMAAKGRSTRGERSWDAKLTESQALEIRRLLTTTNQSQEAIGRMFGISQYAVSAIKLRKTWAHI